jgi:D-amino-acid dehydrogenase
MEVEREIVLATGGCRISRLEQAAMTHIGAGITGVTAAYALDERRYEVTVFDQHRYAGMETSFANGGQISASSAEVSNKLSTVSQGLRWVNL